MRHTIRRRSIQHRSMPYPQLLLTATFMAMALLTAVETLAPSAVSAAPITFNTALPVTAGQGIFRLQWKSLVFGDDASALDRDLSVQAIPLVGVWGVSRRLALFGIVPLLDKRVRVDTPFGRRRRDVSGIGDVTLLARWTAWQRDQQGATLRVAPFLGIEAPTGENDAEDGLGPLPPTLQLGSGSWDWRVGAVVTRQTLAWQLDSSLAYQLNTAADGFEFGDELRFDISYQKRLVPRRLTGGVPAFLYGVLESNLVQRDRNRVAGIQDPNSGGTVWYLAPGLQYVRRRFIVEGAIQLPIAQDLHGDALESEWISTLSMRVNL